MLDVLSASPRERGGRNRHADLRIPWSLDSKTGEVMRCESVGSRVASKTAPVRNLDHERVG